MERVGLFLLLDLFFWVTVFAADEPGKDRVTVEKLFDFPQPFATRLTCFPNTNQFFVYHFVQKPNLVYHWSIKEKKVLKTYDIGRGYVCDGIKISEDGRLTLIACHRNDDFTWKVLLIDNQRKTLIRNIPIDLPAVTNTGVSENGEVILPAVTAMNFSTNSESFALTGNFRTAICYDTTGRRIPDSDVPASVAITNQRVWVVENSKGTLREKWGVYCRDDAGKEHRLHDYGPNGNLVVTGDNRYVAVGSNGELLVWRLSDAQEISRLHLGRGLICYDAADNLILWAAASAASGSELFGIRIRIQFP